MSILEIMVLLVGFTGSAVAAMVIVFLARDTGSLHREQRPGMAPMKHGK